MLGKELIKHWLAVIDKEHINPSKRYTTRKRYLCNGACGITKEKIAKFPSEVTCKNCLREMEKLRQSILLTAITNRGRIKW